MKLVSFCREFHKLSRAWLFELRGLIVSKIFDLKDKVVETCVFMDGVIIFRLFVKMLKRKLKF